MQIIDNVKEMIDLAKKGMTIELQQKLVELKEREISLREENMSLKETIKRLEDDIKKDSHLSIDGKVYWMTIKDNDKDGPYCQRCYDSNKKLIHLQDQGSYYKCLECKSIVDK